MYKPWAYGVILVCIVFLLCGFSVWTSKRCSENTAQREYHSTRTASSILITDEPNGSESTDENKDDSTLVIKDQPCQPSYCCPSCWGSHRDPPRNTAPPTPPLPLPPPPHGTKPPPQPRETTEGKKQAETSLSRTTCE